MPETTALKHLADLWDDEAANRLGGNELSLLRYRSNLLGADLRITNFGGGNTSSKIDMTDPFTGAPVRVLAVKGSGGDLGSITDAGFALLYLDKLEQLKARYRGEAFEDEMVDYYPPAAFGHNRVAASIDTPLHAFLPAPHVDHLHPDWAIALAASANGRQKLEEFNRRFGRRIIWVPWQRPGFELALLIESAVKDNPGADGLILGSHGLFTWGATQRECYLNSIRTIDQMGAFIDEHRAGTQVFGGLAHKPLDGRHDIAARILPALRGTVSSNRRVIAHFTDTDEALTFAGSEWAQGAEPSRHELSRSLPAHAHLSVFRRMGSFDGLGRYAQGGYSRTSGRVPERIPALLRLVRGARFAETARRQPVGRHHPRRGAVRFRPQQEGSTHCHRVFPERHQRHGRRHRP